MWDLLRTELALSKRLLYIMAIASALLALGALVYYGYWQRGAAAEAWTWSMLSHGLGTALVPYITLHWHMVSGDKEQWRRPGGASPLTQRQIGWSRNLYLLSGGAFAALCTSLVLYAPLQAALGQRLALWFSLGGAALLLAFFIRLVYQWIRPQTDYFSIVVYVLVLESDFFLQMQRNPALSLRFDQLSRQLYDPRLGLAFFAAAAALAYLTQALFVRQCRRA